jgi:hypothetical protein
MVRKWHSASKSPGSCNQCDAPFNEGTYAGTGILKGKVVDYHNCPACGFQGTVPAKGTTSSKTAADMGPDGKRLTHEGPWNRAKNVHPDEYMAGRNEANAHSLDLTDQEKMREAERHNGAFYHGTDGNVGTTQERAHHAGQADSYAEKAMGSGGRSGVSFGIGTHTFHPQELGKSSSKTADGPGYTETVTDPFNAFTPQEGECPTCFGEGAFSELLPSGKGFGPEHECSDCGGTGRAS